MGNTQMINIEIIESAKSGFELVLSILPIIVLWMGLMKIAEDSGLLIKFSKKIAPLLSKIFPSLKNDSKALGYIASNIAANAFGLGNAATPFGLKAMEEMQKENKKKDTATDAMVTFLVLNTSGVTIIPTTVIALRMAHGSANPTEIIITAIIATFIATTSGLIMDYLLRRKRT